MVTAALPAISGPEDRTRVREKLRALLERWKGDPARFAWDLFRVRLWRRQVEVCHAVTKYRRVAVKSGHKVGKSISIAILALWWVVTRPNGRVVLTAPTAAQIRGTLWLEVRKLVDIANERLKGIGGFGGKLNELPDRGLDLGPGHYIIGRSTNKAERMAGTSGAELLYLVDEASGVDQKIFETIEGNLQGGGRLVLFSNPTQTSGEFFDAFNTKKALYHGITISSEETPNVIAGRMVIEGLATREAILDNRRAWGPDYRNDPRYQVRVLGLFPSSSSFNVITLDLVGHATTEWWTAAGQTLGQLEAALDDKQRSSLFARNPGSLDRVHAAWRAGREQLRIGVDPARFGDDVTVIFPRRGLRAFTPVSVKGLDGHQVAQVVLQVIKEYRHGNERARVLIDNIGIGASAEDVLVRMQGIEVIPINAGKAAANPDLYFNLRSEMLFGLQRWLKVGGGFAPHPSLETELVAHRYDFDEQGRLRVEKKDAIKARIGRSPNFADALALACYEGAEPVRVVPVSDYADMPRLEMAQDQLY